MMENEKQLTGSRNHRTTNIAKLMIATTDIKEDLLVVDELQPFSLHVVMHPCDNEHFLEEAIVCCCLKVSYIVYMVGQKNS